MMAVLTLAKAEKEDLQTRACGRKYMLDGLERGGRDQGGRGRVIRSG